MRRLAAVHGLPATSTCRCSRGRLAVGGDVGGGVGRRHGLRRRRAGARLPIGRAPRRPVRDIQKCVLLTSNPQWNSHDEDLEVESLDFIGEHPDAEAVIVFCDPRRPACASATGGSTAPPSSWGSAGDGASPGQAAAHRRGSDRLEDDRRAADTAGSWWAEAPPNHLLLTDYEPGCERTRTNNSP